MRATIPSFLVLFLVGCGSGSAEEAPTLEGGVVDPLGSGWVTTAAASALAVPTRIDAPGRVVVPNDDDARVSAPIAGRVRTVHVREGATVKAGDLLVTLESREAAGLRAETVALGIDLRAARAELDRQTRLAASGAGLPVEHLRAEADVQRTEAAHTAAQRASSLLGPGSGEAVEVRAPRPGTVLSVDARPGLAVTGDGAALVSLADGAARHVRLEVYEDELPRVVVGQVVTVTTADGEPPVSGTVAEVAGAAAPDTRRGPVLVELSATPPGWVAGRLVRGRIDAAAAAAVAVPVGAVVIRPDRSRVVYVEDGGRLAARPVDVGPVTDGVVPILRGLDGGEQVVVEGALLVDALADRLL